MKSDPKKLENQLQLDGLSPPQANGFAGIQVRSSVANVHRGGF